VTARVSSGAGPFAGLVAGPGFYKLGYVPADREKAVNVLQVQYSVAEFARFDPELTVTSEGTTVRRL
jgi:hypothetical protein